MKEIDIVYRNSEIAVIVKPPGMEAETETAEALKKQLYGKDAAASEKAASGNPAQPEVYCVHRLDRNVGGLMAYALTRRAAAALSQDIQENRFHKTYMLVCEGRVEPMTGEMRDFLLKDNEKKKTFPVKSMRKGVKEAKLFYRVTGTEMLSGAEVTLAKVQLETGRYHQIRVQFASRKHPLLGDRKYGSRVKSPLALWSAGLEFTDPESGRPVNFEKEPPAEFPWKLFR